MRWLTVGVPGQGTSLLRRSSAGRGTTSRPPPRSASSSPRAPSAASSSASTTSRDVRRAPRRRRRDHPGAGRAALRHRLRHARPLRQPRPDQPAQRGSERKRAHRGEEHRHGPSTAAVPTALQGGHRPRGAAAILQAVVYPQRQQGVRPRAGHRDAGDVGALPIGVRGCAERTWCPLPRAITSSVSVLEGSGTVLAATDWATCHAGPPGGYRPA